MKSDLQETWLKMSDVERDWLVVRYNAGHAKQHRRMRQRLDELEPADLHRIAELVAQWPDEDLEVFDEMTDAELVMLGIEARIQLAERYQRRR